MSEEKVIPCANCGWWGKSVICGHCGRERDSGIKPFSNPDPPTEEQP